MIVTDLTEIGSRGAGDPAVVRIGVDGQADVRLPVDCSERELNLACRLLVQIVRLRRRERLAAQIHQELSAQAMTDPLTGLANRRAWEAALKERVAMAATGENQLCLAILDLDHFKRINDDHGHAIGDEVLRATGQAVYDNLRQDDFVARLGGDEFGLLLWAPDEEVAAAVVERVRTALPPRFSRTVLPALTASAGYRLTGALPCPSPEALYAAADARSARRSVAGGPHRGTLFAAAHGVLDRFVTGRRRASRRLCAFSAAVGAREEKRRIPGTTVLS